MQKDDTRRGLGLSRRGFLGAGSAVLTAGAWGGLAGWPTNVRAAALGPLDTGGRQFRAYQIREGAAWDFVTETFAPAENNGDEDLYSNRHASFSKCLPHDARGLVDLDAYEILLHALSSGDHSVFEAVPLAGDRKLVNPQAAYAYAISGPDSHTTRIAPAPAFASATIAAEIGELYWQALTRDVPYQHYATDPLTNAAVADLNRFSAAVGPKENGLVTTATLFRGETAGDLVGPYISQFLWLAVPYGLSTIIQQYPIPLAGVDFMTDYAAWLDVQRGVLPTQAIAYENTRYINNNRALGEYVHHDVLSQAFFNAALIMLSYGAEALDPNNPYRDSLTQEPFVSFGLIDILDLLTTATRIGMNGGWYQKWLVHRRLRPEVYAGRVEDRINGDLPYTVHPDVLNSAAVAELLTRQGTALLPQAFPEGSPAHPSYPAGHACASGACATILKAFFNEDFVIPTPVEASADGALLEPWLGDALTLRGEINKLAANISLGRDAAGVHYRSDGIQGMQVGEQQALGLLRDCSRLYGPDFVGFELTRFNGERVRIQDGVVITLG